MSSTADARLAEIAHRQRGLFTLRQALVAGFARSTVQRRLQRGSWIDVGSRVYLAGTTVVRPEQRLLAVILAVDGLAWRRSAAGPFGLVPMPRRPEVVVERARRTASWPPGVHSTDVLPPEDRTVVAGIPTTTPNRAVLDLAGCVSRDRMEDVLDLSIVRGLVRPGRLAQRARELSAPARPGCAVILGLLDARHPDIQRARNEWEARLLRELRLGGLPDPVPNHEVIAGGRRRILDVAWPAARVAIEFDGFVPHSSRRVFDDDRMRQNDLVDAGWTLFRLTATALAAGRHTWIDPVRRALQRAALDPGAGRTRPSR